MGAGGAGLFLGRPALPAPWLGGIAFPEPGHEQLGHAWRWRRLRLLHPGPAGAGALPPGYCPLLLRGYGGDRQPHPAGQMAGGPGQGAHLGGDPALGGAAAPDGAGGPGGSGTGYPHPGHRPGRPGPGPPRGAHRHRWRGGARRELGRRVHAHRRAPAGGPGAGRQGGGRHPQPDRGAALSRHPPRRRHGAGPDHPPGPGGPGGEAAHPGPGGPHRRRLRAGGDGPGPGDLRRLAAGRARAGAELCLRRGGERAGGGLPLRHGPGDADRHPGRDRPGGGDGPAVSQRPGPGAAGRGGHPGLRQNRHPDPRPPHGDRHRRPGR